MTVMMNLQGKSLAMRYTSTQKASTWAARMKKLTPSFTATGRQPTFFWVRMF